MQMQRHPKTQELIDYLTTIPDGVSVTFHQIARDCDWDKKKQSHYLQSAIKALADQGIIFKSIRGVGYVRLDPDKGIYRVRDWHGGQLKRSTHRMVNKVSGTCVGQLSHEGRKQWQQAQDDILVRRMYLEQIERENRKADLESKLRERERQRLIKEQEETLALLERLEQSAP